MKRLMMAGLTMALAAVLVAGCGKSVTQGNEDGEKDLLAEYGGYTTDNEAPGFGDADLIAGHPEDAPYHDDMADSSEVSNAEKNRGAKKYMLRMVWGNLDNPDTSETAGSCPTTDWSGSIEADGGILIIRRLIRFEPGDSIVRPRHGAREVEWISHPGNHVDGILFQIIDVPDPRHKEVKNTVTITTPLYTAEIPFDSLAEYNQLVTYDECNKMSLVGTMLERVRCPMGFMEGTWASETDTSGNFEGAWIGDGGALDGYVQGYYTVRDSVGVLFGKWITTSGEFGGLMKGTWGPLVDQDEEEAREDCQGGYFEGKWVDDALVDVGRFKGHYCFPDSTEDGIFRGRWMQDCK